MLLLVERRYVVVKTGQDAVSTIAPVLIQVTLFIYYVTRTKVHEKNKRKNAKKTHTKHIAVTLGYNAYATISGEVK